MKSAGTVNVKSLIQSISAIFEEQFYFGFQRGSQIISVLIALGFLSACHHFLENYFVDPLAS